MGFVELAFCDSGWGQWSALRAIRTGPITFRVVAQASSQFWRPCWVVEWLRWGVALVLLEPCELLDGVRER